MTTKQITLPIAGMTCASCVSHVEGALKNLSGVAEAVVNLGAGKASIEFDPARASIAQMSAAVADLGYKVATAQATLNVSGMTCASCVAHVEGALKELDGVTNAGVALALNTAKIEYIRGLVTVAQMKRAVHDAGYEAAERDAGVSAIDREREARQRE